MADKQQTAVQWLVKQLLGDVKDCKGGIIQQAISMEREQIVDAHYEGQCHNLEGYQKYIKKLYTAHQYFTDTYQTEL